MDMAQKFTSGSLSVNPLYIYMPRLHSAVPTRSPPGSESLITSKKNSSMAQIRGNTARDATQVNANINSIYVTVLASEVKHSPEVATKACTLGVAELLEPLISSRRESFTSQNEAGLLAGSRSPGRQSSPDHKHAKRDLSVLKHFHGESERAAAYRRVQGRPIGSRFILNWDRIGPWLNSEESTLLATYGPLNEATKLTFETIQVVDLIIKRSQQSSRELRLVHPFGEKPNQKKGNPNIIVLDLISQVTKHHEKISGLPQSPETLIHMESAGPKLLWDIFWQRVREAGIQRLFIFLDNVDRFFLVEAPSDQVKWALKYLVDNLKHPNQQSGFQTKVWVTCNTRNMVDCFR